MWGRNWMLFKESGDSENEGRSETEKYSCCLWVHAGLLTEQPAIANCKAKEIRSFSLLFYYTTCFFYAKQLAKLFLFLHDVRQFTHTQKTDQVLDWH